MGPGRTSGLSRSGRLGWVLLRAAGWPPGHGSRQAAPNPTWPWDSCRPWLHLNFQTLPGSPGQASPASSAEVTGKITRDQAPPRPTPCASPARTHARARARRAALPDSWECRAGGSAPAVRVDHSGKALGQSRGTLGPRRPLRRAARGAAALPSTPRAAARSALLHSTANTSRGGRPDGKPQRTGRRRRRRVHTAAGAASRRVTYKRLWETESRKSVSGGVRAGGRRGPRRMHRTAAAPWPGGGPGHSVAAACASHVPLGLCRAPTPQASSSVPRLERRGGGGSAVLGRAAPRRGAVGGTAGPGASVQGEGRD